MVLELRMRVGGRAGNSFEVSVKLCTDIREEGSNTDC